MAIREDLPKDSGTALVVMGSKEPITVVAFFKPAGSDAVLERMREEVRRQAAELDISTPKGREAIASLAYKVARTKTAVDEMGKAVVEDQKRTITEVDTERRKFREACDELKDEVRKPLTDWENEEKERIQAHEAAITIMMAEAGAAIGTEDPQAIEDKLALIDKLLTGRNWQEFKQRAQAAWSTANQELKAALERAARRQAEQAELERLRAGFCARACASNSLRHERIAREAREEAERVAEQKRQRQAELAERERERLENERLQAEAKARWAEVERVQEAERARIALEEAEQRRIREAEQAEQRRIEEQQATARRAQESAAAAARNLEIAVQQERQRQADEARRIAAETEKRESSRRHVNAVNKKIVESFMLNGAPHDIADKIVTAIAQGRVPKVSIAY